MNSERLYFFIFSPISPCINLEHHFRIFCPTDTESPTVLFLRLRRFEESQRHRSAAAQVVDAPRSSGAIARKEDLQPAQPAQPFSRENVELFLKDRGATFLDFCLQNPGAGLNDLNDLNGSICAKCRISAVLSFIVILYHFVMFYVSENDLMDFNTDNRL